jgi:hypothetical protein
MMRLSPKQREALTRLREKDGSAYGMKVSLATLEALSLIGLVRAIGHGHMAFPRSGTWRITDDGKAAIFKLSETDMQTCTYSRADLRLLMMNDAGIGADEIESEEWAADGSLTFVLKHVEDEIPD